MRFGICAISWILPKFLRRRLRPVNERVIRVGPLRLGGRVCPGGNQQFQTNGKSHRAHRRANRRWGVGERNMHSNAVFQSAGALSYFNSTLAPASSSCFLILAASSLLTSAFTSLGAPSTRSLASLRPRPVIARTSLITLIFLSPASVRTTVNSVFSAAGAAPAAAGAAAAATGAAAETPHFSSRSLARSAASRTVREDRSSTSFSIFDIFQSSFSLVQVWMFTLL